MILISRSPEETQRIASNLARGFKTKGGVIALSGDLGAGKTTFTQGFARGLGIHGKIISPTFVLIREYPVPNSHRRFFHVDLYRLEKHPDLKALGLGEIIRDKEAIVLIEWADRLIPAQLGKATQVTIKKISDTDRELRIRE